MDGQQDKRPWYREFWPWFLMLFPAAAVVGGIITWRVAASTNDGVVDDDYYKQGLAINKVLARGQAAAALGLSAVAQFRRGEVHLSLVGHPTVWPQQVVLRILHPTRAGLDQSLVLTGDGRGGYHGTCRDLAGGKWKLLLEDTGQQWRLAGEVEPGQTTARLSPIQ